MLIKKNKINQTINSLIYQILVLKLYKKVFRHGAKFSQ